MKAELLQISSLPSLNFEVVFTDINYGVRGNNPLDFLPIHSKNHVHVPKKFGEKYGGENASRGSQDTNLVDSR